MTRKMGIKWHLRSLMATRSMFSTSDILPKLAERGISLSREQVYRLVTQTPQRLSMPILAALCDILDCRVDDLIEIFAEKKPLRKAASGESLQDIGDLKP